MKKTSLYNNLPDEIVKPTILKKNEVVIWKTTKIYPDPMKPGRFAIPNQNVPAIDTILVETEDRTDYIDIALVKSIDSKNNHNFYQVEFSQQGGGMITLVGGRSADQEIHTYMTLSNYNKNKPNRDENKEVVFEIVDNKAKSIADTKIRNKKREALNTAADLSAQDVRDYSAALGQDDTQPVEVLRNNLEALADLNPEDFLKLIANKSSVVKAAINRALKGGVITFSTEESKFSWPTGEPILTTSRNSDAVEELVTYLVSNAKGEKILQTIQAKKK